ncbi:hypothetical protein AC249_AIPGENE14880 [Exaiptasia diaphana]|nr:hypothetical protein AC249_AIPGENE14880 [Exaiptasia diaphana]
MVPKNKLEHHKNETCRFKPSRCQHCGQLVPEVHMEKMRSTVNNAATENFVCYFLTALLIERISYEWDTVTALRMSGTPLPHSHRTWPSHFW